MSRCAPPATSGAGGDVPALPSTAPVSHGFPAVVRPGGAALIDCQALRVVAGVDAGAARPRQQRADCRERAEQHGSPACGEAARRPGVDAAAQLGGRRAAAVVLVGGVAEQHVRRRGRGGDPERGAAAGVTGGAVGLERDVLERGRGGRVDRAAVSGVRGVRRERRVGDRERAAAVVDRAAAAGRAVVVEPQRAVDVRGAGGDEQAAAAMPMVVADHRVDDVQRPALQRQRTAGEVVRERVEDIVAQRDGPTALEQTGAAEDVEGLAARHPQVRDRDRSHSGHRRCGCCRQRRGWRWAGSWPARRSSRGH